MQMYTDPALFDFVVIMQDEIPTDHEYGNCLEQVGATIKYSALPQDHVALFNGYGRRGRPIPGYERQQWLTFYSDEFSDKEIIAWVDSDTCISQFLTKKDYMTADGKIVLHATRPDRWAGDPAALGGHIVPGGNVDIMWTDMFPIFFWRDTFINVRKSIASQMGKGSFDEAYKVFNKGMYSQFNILANWAIKNEPHRYTLVVHSDGHGRYPTENYVSLGAHKDHGDCGNIAVHAHSCCVAFGVGCDVQYAIAPNKKGWEDEHKKNVEEHVARLRPQQKQRMSDACKTFLAAGNPPEATTAQFCGTRDGNRKWD